MADPHFTFEPRFPDGSPRRLAGTWRPPWLDVIALPRTSTNYPVAYNADRPEMWMKGEFDHPLYYVEGDEADG